MFQCACGDQVLDHVKKLCSGHSWDHLEAGNATTSKGDRSAVEVEDGSHRVYWGIEVVATSVLCCRSSVLAHRAEVYDGKVTPVSMIFSGLKSQ